jgi:hypothetical protein
LGWKDRAFQRAWTFLGNAFPDRVLTGIPVTNGDSHMADQKQQNPGQQKQDPGRKPGESDQKAEIRKGVEQDSPDKKKGQENTEYSGGT